MVGICSGTPKGNQGFRGQEFEKHRSFDSIPTQICLKIGPRPSPPPKEKAQVISPTACGETLVEPSWNLTSGPPRTTPEPIWAETPKLSAVGKNKAFGFPFGFPSIPTP